MSLFYNGFQGELDKHYPYSNAKSLFSIYRYSHRLQIQSICDILSNELNSQQLLLDAGCGCGPYSILLSNMVRVMGLDLSYIAIGKAKIWRDKNERQTKIDLVIGDINNLPFRDMTFDIVLCLEVLEHIQNIRKGLKEFHKVMKKGSIGVISMPNSLSIYYIIQRLIPVITPVAENPHLKYNFINIKNIVSEYFKIITTKSSLIFPVIPTLRFYESMVKWMRLVESKLNKTPFQNFGAHYILKFQNTSPQFKDLDYEIKR